MAISTFSERARRMAFLLADLALLPVILLVSVPLKLFRKLGGRRLPLSRQLFRRVGIWPLRKNYYDPLFDPRDLSVPLNAPRSLPGINWNTEEQLRILQEMDYVEELKSFLKKDNRGPLRYSYDNGSFLSGDADYLYSFIRLNKPRRVIEIGCGNSTLLIAEAVRRNREADAGYECAHTCIEPYENPWLAQLNVKLIRERVERLGIEPFLELQGNDLLFIDSSHIIRPCGDVVFQIIEVLPRLNPGVFAHIHDVFSPRNYLSEWVVELGFLWNEQYLLEAFLSQNGKFKIVGALNYLHHNHYEKLAAICATYDKSREPGSFYIQRIEA
jgi:predicted O-methyltransferase YrrM